MAKYESEGCCLHNVVSSKVMEMSVNEHKGIDLVGLWSLFGPDVVCEKEMEGYECDAVVQLFTRDPLARVLMKKIAKAWSGEKILISTPRKKVWACNVQSGEDLNDAVAAQEQDGHELLLAPQSEFAVVLKKEEGVLHVLVWDLNHTFF